MTRNGDRDEGAPDMRQRPPVLMCLPFLALNQPCRIGRWELLTAKPAFNEGVWASESFRQDAERMLGLFRYGVGHYRLENPTLIARAGRKFTGEPPKAAERDALTATAAFGALDSNRPRDAHGWASWVVAENVDYWEFPVSSDDDLMLSLGRRYRTRFHDTWGEDRPIIGPAVLEPAHSHHVRIDEDLAAVLHEALLSRTELSANLAAAIRFFVDSWRNHPSVVGVADWTFDYSTVVCSQQTALEALFGERNNAAQHIVAGVRNLTKRLSDALEATDFASPTGGLPIDLCMSMRSKPIGGVPFYEDAAFDDWARKFTRVRNKTVHEGDPLAALSDDEHPGKTLRDVVDTADIVIRDALHLLACFRSDDHRASGLGTTSATGGKVPPDS